MAPRWVWACKNRLLGPDHTDSGVFTLLPGVVAGTLATLPGAPMQKHALHKSSWPHARCLDGTSPVPEPRAA